MGDAGKTGDLGDSVTWLMRVTLVTRENKGDMGNG